MSEAEVLKVILSEIELMKQSLENIEIKLKMKEPVKEEPIPAAITKETTKDYLEITELPPGTLTIGEVCEKLEENKITEVCNSKKKFGLHGQILSLKPGGINHRTNKSFPAKIIFTNDPQKKFQGVIWSKSNEKTLDKLTGHWLVLSKVYFKIVGEKFLDEKLLFFESGDGRDQFEFHVDDCVISVVTEKKEEESKT